MKTVVAIWHSSNKGKTETVREFANLLLTNYPNCTAIFPISKTVPNIGDFRLVIQINGKIIGVESQGDPGTNLEDRLLDLSDNFNCEIIICTSRTRGETVIAVDNLHYNRGFQSIWTSTYQLASKPQQDIANNLKAKHLLNLIQTLEIL